MHFSLFSGLEFCNENVTQIIVVSLVFIVDLDDFKKSLSAYTESPVNLRFDTDFVFFYLFIVCFIRVHIYIVKLCITYLIILELKMICSKINLVRF